MKIHGMTLMELAEYVEDLTPSADLADKFIERTEKHIGLVNDYGKKIGRSFPDHDSSKLTYLLDGYSFFSKENPTEKEGMYLDLVTYIHITEAPHHPEYWTDTNLDGFTRKNFTPNGIVEATKMPEEYLEEMCADWCAMSFEFGNTPFEWFNKVNDTRWLFSPDQQKFIRNTLRKMWD